MNNPFLSIVIPFCDKDYTLIPQLLKNIKEDVHVSYEVILVDNRDKQRHQMIRFPKNTKVITKGYNCYQFEAKRYAKDFCNGEYIWYVDADDKVLSVPDDLQEEFSKTSPDIVCFNSCFVNENCIICVSQSFVDRAEYDRFLYKKQGEIPDEKLLKLVQKCLWDKWIKTSLLNNIFNSIEEDLEIVASEDVFINEFCQSKAKKICICKDLIYLYRDIISHFQTKTVKNFFHITKGYDIYLQLKEKFIPDRTFISNIDDFKFFLDYAYQTESPEVCITRLEDVFGKEDMIKIMANLKLQSNTNISVE